MSLQMRSLVDTIIRSPLTHFYFYAGGANRGVFKEDLERSVQQVRDLVKNGPWMNESKFTIFANNQSYHHYEITFPHKKVYLKEVSDLEFTPESWNPSTSFVFLPGGEATLIHQQIGNKLDYLRNLSEKGGKIWAQCGSAYWLSKQRTFTFSDENVRSIENANALFPGSSFGPLHNSCKTPSVEFVRGLGSTHTYLAGGGSFTIPESVNGQFKFEPLAFYEDPIDLGKIAAVIGTHPLGGTIVLIHPHLNYDGENIIPEVFDQSFPGCGDWQRIKDKLVDSKEQRMVVLAHIIVRMCEEALPQDRRQ